MTHILVDADGCPVVGETVRIAAAFGVPCVLVCDTAHRFDGRGAEVVTVSQGADEADFALLSRLRPGDVAVTQDFGLAALCLARGARVLRQDGLEYTDGNIDGLLLLRQQASRARRGGRRIKGPRRRTAADDAAFAASLRAVLTEQLQKGEQPMGILERLEPRSVFSIFEAISAIPHGSGNTGRLAQWCLEFAAERGLEAHLDGGGNVVIVRPASPGCESAPPLILQGHLDMVCEKAPGCSRDMEAQGLELAVDGDDVYAVGTTLGGDDGIAVAMILALLEDDRLRHPRLEAVLTADEEIGMLGAAALDVSPIRGRTLLNLDSEEEGVFTVSCAGGCRAECAIPVTRAPFAGTALRIAVSGLRGGHSGTEIRRGGANASVVLGRLLRAAGGVSDLRLVTVGGGLKDNAIPTAAAAVVLAADPQAVGEAVAASAAEVAAEYRVSDPELAVSTEVLAGGADVPMDGLSTGRALALLTCAPNGVQAMSQDIEGLVQTSLSLGILTTEAETVRAVFCIRSAMDSQKRALCGRLACLADLLGGTLEIQGDYPGWAYRPDSPLRERMVAVYREQYGREPVVEAIHAGVECGLLAGKLPGLDCVSIGPNLREIHTPRERMSVSSVQRVYRFVREVVRRSC